MAHNEQPLEDFLLSDGQPDSFVAEEFIINNDEQALWAMRSLAAAQRKVNDLTLTANTEKARIESWLSMVTKSPQSTVDYFTKALTSYALRKREEGIKSLNFPDGYVMTRSTPAKVSVVDAEAFAEWASLHRPEWLRTKVEPDVKKIKTDAQFGDGVVVDPESGEVIIGLEPVAENISVSVAVSE